AGQPQRLLGGEPVLICIRSRVNLKLVDVAIDHVQKYADLGAVRVAAECVRRHALLDLSARCHGIHYERYGRTSTVTRESVNLGVVELRPQFVAPWEPFRE